MNKIMQKLLFRRILLLQAAWNYEKMQNIGFAFVMLPVLEKIYSGKDLTDAIKRHLESFNTQPYMASFIAGVVTKLEEERAAKTGEKERAEMAAQISSTKSFLSTTSAAIGDPYFWGALRPFSLIVLLWVCQFFGFWQWSIPESVLSVKLSPVLLIAVLLSALVYNWVVADVRWRGIKRGYDHCHGAACGLDVYNWKKVIRNIKYLTFAMAAMVVIGSCYALSSYISDEGFRVLVIPVACALALLLKRISMMYVYFLLIAVSSVYFLLGGKL